MSTQQDRRLDLIAEVFNRRPDPISGNLFTVEDIGQAIETLEADPNPAFILGIPNAQFAVLVASETKRIGAQLQARETRETSS